MYQCKDLQDKRDRCTGQHWGVYYPMEQQYQVF